MLDVGSVSYEEEAARHTYQALNSLLVAELPQFNQLMLQSLGHILRTLVALQEDLAKQVLQRAEGSLAQVQPPLTLALGSCGFLCKSSQPSSSYGWFWR